MSKSLGNAVSPQTIADKNGADILRLWVASSDFTEICGSAPTSSRPMSTPIAACATRSVSCWRICGFRERERIGVREMPELERYMLANSPNSMRWCATAMRNTISTGSINALFNFCTIDLSAFYFDIRKDALYCDPPLRRAAAPRAP